MPKNKLSKKSQRNYSKGKHGTIKQKKLERKVRMEKKVREDKLMNREFDDSDEEMDRREERHIKLMKKSATGKLASGEATGAQTDAEKKPASEKHEITEEEIANFWQQLEMKKGAAKTEDDRMVDKLLEDVQDDYDVIETDFEGNTTEQQLEGDDEEEVDAMDDASEEEEEGDDNRSDDIEASDNEDATRQLDIQEPVDEDGVEFRVDADETDQIDTEAIEAPQQDQQPDLSNKQLKRQNEKKFASAFGIHLSEFATASDFIKKVLVTKEMTQGWIEASQEGKKKATKQLLVAFYTASLQFGERTADEENSFQTSPFRIDSPSIYMRIVLGSLKFAPEALWTIMNIPSSTATMPNKDLLRKKKIQPLVTLFCKAAIRFFTYTSKADALKYALQYLIGGLPFFSSSIPPSKSLIKILLGLLHHADEVVRVRAFMVLHEMASKYPKPMPELILKGAYYTFFQYAAEYKPENAKVIDFHKNCIVELYGINFDLSYKHAYSYIRGLAETFQSALKNSSAQSRKSLINWRFVNCLDCWTHVLSAYPGNDEMGELIFPFTQLIMGVAVLFKENPIWVPLRLRCARMLNQLSLSSGLFIPSCSILLSMLKERNVVEKKFQSSVTPIDFEFKNRLSEKVVRTVEFQRNAVSEWTFQVASSLMPHVRSVAFPEIANPILRAIISFRHDYFGRKIYGTADKRKKVTNDAKYLEMLKKLQKAIEEQTQQVLLKRANITFSPKEMIEDKKSALDKDMGKDQIFDKNHTTSYERYFEALKKEHDADVLRRMVSYQQHLLSTKPKDEVDMEIEKSAKKAEASSQDNKRKRHESNEETEQVERKSQKKRVKLAAKPSRKADNVTSLDMDDFFEG